MYEDRCGRKWDVELVPISSIKVGDTVVHEGDAVTVSRRDFVMCDFMGLIFRGDSYCLGRKKIQRLTPARL